MRSWTPGLVVIGFGSAADSADGARPVEEAEREASLAVGAGIRTVPRSRVLLAAAAAPCFGAAAGERATPGLLACERPAPLKAIGPAAEVRTPIRTTALRNCRGRRWGVFPRADGVPVERCFRIHFPTASLRWV